MKVAKAYCGFFDSTQEQSYQYTEADLARYTDTMVASGVRDADSLRVTTADDGLKVQLGYGSAMVGGHYYALEDDGGGAQTLTLRAAVSKPRIDRVIVRLNSADGVRSVAPAVLEGAEADMPLAPALTRAGTIYEISLAQVYIQVGASVIIPDMVKDERADGEVCGVLRTLTEAQTCRCRNGNPVPHIALPEGEYRVFAPDGAFLMLGRCSGRTLYTVKSFFEVTP